MSGAGEEVRVNVVGGMQLPRRGHVAAVHPETTYNDLLATARLLFAGLKRGWRRAGGVALSAQDADDVGLFLVASNNELLGSLQDADVGPFSEKEIDFFFFFSLSKISHSPQHQRP